MNLPLFFDSKNSSILYGMDDNFRFLTNLYIDQKLPRVLMLTGNKGSGKSTLVNHFLYSIFDASNYDQKEKKLAKTSKFLKQFKSEIFSNIIHLRGSEFKTVKIDDIRNLKKNIYQSSISNKDRFIILDDVELFNANSLNALLKLIEEPAKKTFFFLINNKSKPLLETVKSRALEVKIILNENQRIEIIENLINFFNLDIVLDPKSSFLSPGSFVKFNHICKEFDILPANDFIKNLSLLLSLYRKYKDILFINLVFFIVDYYLNELKRENNLRNERIYEIKNFIFGNLNNFLIYNINQNSLINAINSKINHE